MAQEKPNTDSVFDFLYVDHARVAIYMSQLRDESRGHLASLTHSETAEQGLGTSAGLSGGVVGVEGKFTTASKGATTQAATYDPTWFLARHVLDLLDEQGAIHRDSSEWQPGRLALASGTLSVVDARIMKPIMGAMLDGMLGNQFAPGKGGKEARQTAAVYKGVFKAFLDNMPQSVIGDLRTKEDRLWCTLAPANLLMSIEELALKFGTHLPGEWHVLAAVDGPAHQSTPEAASPDGAEPQDIGALLGGVMHQLRAHVGRPEGAVPVTPLLIFRAIDIGGR